MGIRTDQNLRQQFIFYTLILMLASLLVSRVALSVSMILFLLATCVHKNFLQQLLIFFKNRFLLGISCLFLIFFVSGLWSDDKQAWLQIVRLKLPLFLLPLAFAGQWHLSSKQWKIVGIVFLFLCFAGCCWSFFQYFKDAQAIEKSYLKAKSILTPLENDHVRFSLLVCIAVIACVALYKEMMLKSRKIILVAAGIFFIIYLHVLVARTGLFAFYIFLLLWLIYLFSF